MTRRRNCDRGAVALAVFFSALASSGRAELIVSPASVRLDRPEASHQLLVTETTGATRRDATRVARYEHPAPIVARVDADGLLHPVAEGSSRIVVLVGDARTEVAVTVSGLVAPELVSFENEIQPILTKARCNSGGCHGKAEGQNGFKLSLFGFDAALDYDAIVRESKGRRIALAHPTGSLLVRKGAAQMPHGGGLKIEADSPAYRRLVRWIASGAPRTKPDDEPIASLAVEPSHVVLGPGEQQQLRVSATTAGGATRCVTAETEFVSNAGHVVEAGSRGLLQASDIPGEAAVLVRYLGQVAVCRIVVPRPQAVVARPPENNFVDKHVWDKLQRLGIAPSEPIGDAEYLRRVFLDVIGTLPTAGEARAFLADTSADKRARLVDRLFERPEYAEFWAMKWSDLLRADKNRITPQGTVGLTRWLRRQFAENRPYDAFVRDLLTAQGPVQSEGPAAFFKALDQPELAGRSVSQLLLGVRIECAQCHHHPSERWGQDDYAGFAGFFTGVSVKRLPGGTETIVARGGKDVNHPRTGEAVPARPLGGEAADFTGTTDRRAVLAHWATAPDNAFLSRAIVNRLWAHYFGRGLVEPIDDLRATNPPTNEPLMDALAAHLVAVRFDLRAFTRTLLASRTYALSSTPNDSNRDDRQHFSHAMPKALPAEVLLDAICQTTGVPEKFNGWPLGVRSIQVWDNRMPSYFFRVFGRPVRATVCECERSNEPSISQALHLLNSPEINAKLEHRHGTARRLADSSRTPDEIIDEIYLGALARFPAPGERELMQSAFAATADRRQATADVLWAVLNTKDFLYNH